MDMSASPTPTSQEKQQEAPPAASGFKWWYILLIILAVIVLATIAYFGFKYMTSGGSQNSLKNNGVNNRR